METNKNKPSTSSNINMVDVTELSSEKNVDQIEANFKKPNEKINKIQNDEDINIIYKNTMPRTMTKNYYPRPTLQIYNMNN